MYADCDKGNWMSYSCSFGVESVHPKCKRNGCGFLRCVVACSMPDRMCNMLQTTRAQEVADTRRIILFKMF